MRMCTVGKLWQFFCPKDTSIRPLGSSGGDGWGRGGCWWSPSHGFQQFERLWCYRSKKYMTPLRVFFSAQQMFCQTCGHNDGPKKHKAPTFFVWRSAHCLAAHNPGMSFSCSCPRVLDHHSPEFLHLEVSPLSPSFGSGGDGVWVAHEWRLEDIPEERVGRLTKLWSCLSLGFQPLSCFQGEQQLWMRVSMAKLSARWANFQILWPILLLFVQDKWDCQMSELTRQWFVAKVDWSFKKLEGCFC